MGIVALYQEPYSLNRRRYVHTDGLTVAEMVARSPGFPSEGGKVCIDGIEVPRALWGMIRPKPVNRAGRSVIVTLHAPILGGGDSGKSVFALVASFAVMALSGFIGAGGLGGFFGKKAVLFGIKGLAASALGTATAIGGALLIGALTAPPLIDRKNSNSGDIRNPGAASADGNQLAPSGPIPRVVGIRKVFPPLASEPFTYFSGPDEVVEAAYILAGPHSMTDVRIDDAPVADMAGVEVEVREGFPGDAPITILSRQSRTDLSQEELRGHIVADDGVTLEINTASLADSLPLPLTAVSRQEPDEVQIQIVFPQGLHKNALETIKLRVPFRIRIRLVGETSWTDLPELHFRAANIKQMRSTITLRWTNDPDDAAPDAAPGEGYTEARISTPAQTKAPSAPAWSASSYFDKGSGAEFMDSSNLDSTAVRRVAMTRYGVTMMLDEAIFPRGRYEIEIRRGQVFDEADYNKTAYTLGGDVYDLFGSYGTPARVFFNRDLVSDAAYVQRVISVWDQTPLPTDDFAVVAVRASNRQINRLSVLAGGYVRDLTTNAWITTSNPAPHLYDIWQGHLNADPVPYQIIDLDALLEWEAHCDAEGYECNALMEDQTVADAERIVASCGYAKPITSDRWSIVMDRDRSAEAPVQIFTPRNSANFRMSKGFADVPDGFLVTFRDETREYDSNQIVHPPEAADSDFIEQITYEGLVREDEVRRRAQFDLDQVRQRSTFYTIDVPTESIVCRRGSLVGVSNDVLSGEAGFSRIVGYKVDGESDVTEIHLDAEVRVTNEGDVQAVADMRAVLNMHALGSPTKAHIRQKNGSIVTRTVTGATGDRSVIVLDAPVPSSQIGRDTLVATGRSRPDFNRMIVFAIRPRPQLMATLTLVDEAPELWNPA